MNELSVTQPNPPGSGNLKSDGCKMSIDDPISKGQIDLLGDEVVRVLVLTDRFIIYSVMPDSAPSKARKSSDSKEEPEADADQSNGADHVWLRTQYPTDYECAKKIRMRLGDIAADMAYICYVVDNICKSETRDDGRSVSLRRRVTEMMARAMEMAYEENQTGAKELLQRLCNSVTALRDSKNRMRYVTTNLIALGVVLAFWFLSELIFDVRSSLVLIVGEAPDVFNVYALDVLALGGIGAFFAVSFSVSSLRVHHSLTLWEVIYTGFVRIPIGVIAAGVAVFLISGEWLLASIQPALLPWTYYLFGFLAGFSELFVPNALRQVEAASTVAAPPPAQV